MNSNVVKIYTQKSDENPDMVLEQCMGNYEEVIVIGYDKLGELDVRASTNWKIPDILFAVEAFKHKLMSGDYSPE